MMTLEKKQPLINNDINWNRINKPALITTIGITITFLITIQLVILP